MVRTRGVTKCSKCFQHKPTAEIRSAICGGCRQARKAKHTLLVKEGRQKAKVRGGEKHAAAAFIAALRMLATEWPESEQTRLEGDLLSAYFSYMTDGRKPAIDRLRATANRLESRSPTTETEIATDDNDEDEKVA